MYPPRFDYRRAGTVQEAIDLLEAHADEEAELLAGGHSLLPTMKSGLARPDVLIDIGDVEELRGVERDGATTRFGALTTYAEIADSPTAREHARSVAEAAGEIGDVQVRNRGTIGGNVAHSDPGSDLPAAVLVSNATLHARGPDGAREIDADEFFLGMYATALEDGELLTAIEVPNLGPGDAGAYVKKASPSSGYAMVGVAARLRTDGREIESARVAANGALDHATRLRSVEDALAERSLDDPDLAAAADGAPEGFDEWEFMDDVQASAEFRAHLLEVYAGRAIEAAAARAAE